uniref:UspA domain-containing protein n=1 Tax=Nelumbo nucifera TaxID=4432 RepID=A0A822YLN8_NELNU|nr:TPA_asm: hypothetical protein HUJ06_010667 [Nelumbo nucifera]
MAEEGGKKVMVAIDESEFSHYALEWTLDNLHNSISTSPLVVFTVQPITDLSYLSAASYGAVHPDLIKSVQEHQQKL